MREHMAKRGWIVCSLILLFASTAQAQYDSPAWRRVLFGGTGTGPFVTSHATACPGNVAAPIGSLCVDRDDGSVWVKTSGTGTSGWSTVGGGGGGAPTTATYITQTADGTLSAEQAMGSLATGIVKNATTTGVQSIATLGTDYFAPAAAMTPDADNTRNVGAAATKWADAYVTRLGIGSGTPSFTSPAKAFHLAQTFSGALGSNEQRGAFFDVTYTPSASWSGGAQALYVKSQHTGTQASTGVVYGGLFQVNSTTTGTAAVEVGVRGSIDRSGGNTTVAVPMSSFAGITSGNIGTLFSFELLQPTLGSGGTITNNYGLFIHDQTVAGATESWALKYDAPSSNAFGVKADGTLHVGGVDVPSCSNATTSKLLFSTTTKEFSCGTDQDNGAAASFYQTVQDETTGLTQRATINFTGSGVTCVDNSGSSRTDCTVTGGTAGVVVQKAMTETGAVATGTTIIPNDDTIPQNTEGDQYMSLAITPLSSSNYLLVEAQVFATTSTQAWILVTGFQDTTANALGVRGLFVTTATGGGTVPLTFKVPTISAGVSTTIKIRAGLHTAGTLTFNGQAGARKFGGISVSTLTISEITP